MEESEVEGQPSRPMPTVDGTYLQTSASLPDRGEISRPERVVLTWEMSRPTRWPVPHRRHRAIRQIVASSMSIAKAVRNSDAHRGGRSRQARPESRTFTDHTRCWTRR